MAEEVLWELAADAEPTLAAFDEITSAGEALGEALTAIFQQVEESVAMLTDSLGGLASAVADTAGSMDALDGSLASTAGAEGEAAAGADATAGAMDTASASASTMGDALQAAMGPLMMIATVAALAGGKLVSMGMDGQKGEALLSGMAGASQQDIQALQVEALKLGVSMDKASAGFYEVESAGYSGSQGITVFDNAMKLAEGGQAQASDVMTGLTAIMHDYNIKAQDSGHVTDLMAEAVLRGKQQMQDFATSIGPLASAGHNAGVSLQEVLAAEATMTQINPHVRQDTMQLAGLFQSLSPTMGHTAETAKKLGLSFNETHYASLDLMGKLQYLAQIAGGDNTAAFIKLTGGVRGSTAAIDLLTGKSASFKGNLNAMGHAAGATQHAFDSWENTVPAHLDKVGAALSVLSTRFMDAIGPKVIPIIDAVTKGIGQFADFCSSHLNIVIPIVAGLAGVLGVLLVGAIGSLLAPIGLLIAAIWPVMLAIGAIGAGAVLLYQHWNQLVGAFSNHGPFSAVLQVFREIGSYIAAQFKPLWADLVTLWQGQLMPLFKQLWSAIQPLMPIFQGLGLLIGGLIVVNIGILTGVLTGLIKGFAGFLSGLMIVIHGIVQLFTGWVQIFSGILAFFYDLFTGHFSKLQSDLGTIWQGIINVIMGAWTVIAGIFLTAWFTISGYVTGFVEGIIGFFTHLWDALVGHSIIPDMINGIIGWFGQLPSKAMNFISSLVSQITGALGSLGSQAVVWAGDMINGFVQGIQNGIGNVTNAVQNIAGTVKKFLGFSKPEDGPLAQADKFMPDFVELMAHGLESNTARLKQAVNGVAGSLAQAASPQIGAPGATQSTSISGGASSTILAQILSTLQQQRSGPMVHVPPSITMYNNNQFSGIQNLQQLYEALNQMAGQQGESMSRGAY